MGTAAASTSTSSLDPHDDDAIVWSWSQSVLVRDRCTTVSSAVPRRAVQALDLLGDPLEAEANSTSFFIFVLLHPTGLLRQELPKFQVLLAKLVDLVTRRCDRG
jgi:hypothetical protein